MSGEKSVIAAFTNFLNASDKWEQEACDREDEWDDDVEGKSIYEYAKEALLDVLLPFCTTNCISRIGRVESLGSPSSYGLQGGKIVECVVEGENAKVTTTGTNMFPKSKCRHVYLLVLEDGQWKIDAKKEISESGRERKVGLF